MKIRKWQVFAGVLLLTAIAGCMYLVSHWRDTLEFSQEIALQGEFLNRLEKARKSGDDAAYENALREHITHLQKNFQSAERVFGAKATVNDTALAYARLSVLAKKRGADLESSRYATLAESLCPKLGWQECSAEKIVALAARLDAMPESSANQSRKDG